MLDIAWPELVVIGIVALVAIGPKDLPKVMHTMGQWAGKARSFTHDLKRAFEQVSYESHVNDQKTSPPESVPPPAPLPPESHHDKP